MTLSDCAERALPRQFDREITVVIATYERTRMLQRCLLGLGQQTVPHSQYEVIVVADGSPQDTSLMVAGLPLRYHTRVLNRDHLGQAAAANAGAYEAEGRFCLFLDDDIIPSRTLIEGHLEIQRKTGGALVMGHLDHKSTNSRDAMARMIAREWGRHYHQLSATGQLRNSMDCYGGNISVPTDCFRAVGGFLTDLPRGYDAELAYKLQRLGLPLLFARKAAGTHESNKGWRQAMADFEKEGKGGVYMYRRHPDLLPEMLLGRLQHRGRRFVSLLRFLLALRFPFVPLGFITSYLPDRLLTRTWYAFVHHYAYWRGVQSVFSASHEWQRFLS